jgi:hypothetical protein
MKNLVATLCRARLTRKLTAAVTAFALVFSQSVPALAYGPGDAFGGRNDVSAIVNFRIPLGASLDGKDHVPSFGFMVQRQFQFNDPLYETMSASFRNSTSLTADMMDLRFSMDGKIHSFDVGGFNALRFKTRLNAAADGDEGGGVPNWVWWVGGTVVVAAVAYAANESREKKREQCIGGFYGVQDCGWKPTRPSIHRLDLGPL